MSGEGDAVTIGLSEAGHRELKALKEDGTFAQMADAYRFAVALAIAMGQMAPALEKRTTIFNVGSLDPDDSISKVVGSLYADMREPVYRIVERLAEWGVAEMGRRKANGPLALDEILAEVKARTAT